MTKYSKRLLQIVFLAIATLSFSNARSQCTFNFTGTACVGSLLTFKGPTGFTTYNWDFDGQGTSTNKDGTFTFATSGAKVIKFSGTDATGKACSSQITVQVNDLPIPKVTLVSPADQCYANNLFCFKDETTHPQGVGYTSIIWSLDGSKVFTSTPPQTRCMNVTDPRGGKFDLNVTYTDVNGCIASLSNKAIVNVYEKIGADFTPTISRVGCDSVLLPLKNNSRIAKSLVKSTKWYYRVQGNPPGPWIFITDCYAGVDKMFTKQGNYEIKLEVTDKTNCVDSMIRKNAVQVTDVNTRIVADKDSTCSREPKITFGVTNIPNNASGLLWNFGDPPTGPQNFNNRTWGPSHDFSGLGPYQISLTYSARCGNQTITKKVFDTILIIGPTSAIEAPDNRIKEWQVYQCPKPKMDTVFFDKNFSVFYHNDFNMNNDDSTYKRYDTIITYTNTSTVLRIDTTRDCDGNVVDIKPRYKVKIDTTTSFGGMGHVFNNAQLSLPRPPLPGPTKRQFNYKCVMRLWDFGDDYSVKCTTNTRINYNVNTNCKYSADSLPWHYYRSWDEIMVSDFKNAPMDDAIFIDSNRLCKRLNVWPSDSFYIIEDSILSVPPDATSLSNAGTAPYSAIALRNFLKERGARGPGQREVEDFVEINIPAGSTIKISTEVGQNFGPILFTHNGPKTVKLKRKDVIILEKSTDTFSYNFYLHVKKDTIPKPFYALRLARGEDPKIIGRYKRTPAGKLNFDYKIDYNRFRDLWYSRIPQCFNAKLFHQDTCHPLKCYSENIKQISMMHANAGGVGSGLLKQSIECLGGLNPQYGITFILTDLKPGCTFSDVQINPDSWCDPNGFVPMLALSPGNRPPGLPMAASWQNYGKGGNVPSRYSMQYSASMVCSPTQCVNVGIIIGNGVSKTGTKPLCADTQWYPNFACFPLLDPGFEILTPKPNAVGNRKICKWDPVTVKVKTPNKTNTKDLRNLRWDFGTGNAGPYFSNIYRRFISEDYNHFKKLDYVNGKALDPNKVYHYMVQTRGGEDPKQLPNTNTWVDGSTKVLQGPDTILLAEVSKWDTFADVSLVWDNIKARLEARGFDPFSIDGATMAKMIWNNIGIIGQPASGARGCIDTAGFGRNIKYKLVADPKDVKTLHYRDTSILPTDSTLDKATGKFIRTYTWHPAWAGYYTVALLMTDKSGNCDAFSALPVIVGFGMDVTFLDSIVCRDEGSSLYAVPDYKYFHPDPINFGTWDMYDYWRDAARQIDIINGVPNREGITRWDWSKSDDDVTKPQTIFGGAPYGGTGVGNKSVLLGGGAGLYYKGDSGVYTFRNVATDSTGCKDTFQRRLFISRLDVKFGLKPLTTDCKPVLEFLDSTILHDPCKWALPNMNSGQGCDFINEWEVSWGDNSRTNFYQRNTRSEPGMPFKLTHNYKKYGWYKITFTVKTNQGCVDTFSRWVKFPGPRPKFEYTTKAGNIARICIDETLDFTNLTDKDSLSKTPAWLWNFGDGVYSSSGAATNSHKYTKAGTYKVSMELEDSVIMPPDLFTKCKAVYPDTAAGDAEFIVIVTPRDSVRGKILRNIICAGEFDTFVDLSDTVFKSYKWKVTFPDKTVNTYSTNKDSFPQQFFQKGIYGVRLSPEYDPARPKPWCPMPDDTMTFEVDSIKADFSIDPNTTKPEFKFQRLTLNGVEYRWGFKHNDDITTSGNPFIENLKTNDNPVTWRYEDTGTFWVCLVVKSKAGCLDTICKKVTNDFFSDIRVSNVFTPEELDSKNDLWQVYIQGQNYYSVRITNRYGAKVFATQDGRVHWNGKVDNTGAKCPEGMYYYEIQYRMKDWKDQKIKTVKGGVYLIR